MVRVRVWYVSLVQRGCENVGISVRVIVSVRVLLPIRVRVRVRVRYLLLAF